MVSIVDQLDPNSRHSNRHSPKSFSSLLPILCLWPSIFFRLGFSQGSRTSRFVISHDPRSQPSNSTLQPSRGLDDSSHSNSLSSSIYGETRVHSCLQCQHFSLSDRHNFSTASTLARTGFNDTFPLVFYPFLLSPICTANLSLSLSFPYSVNFVEVAWEER